MTTSRLLSTGVDVPTCQNIVLARPVGSLVEFKQIIGRGSRLYEPDKTWFTIRDYAGAIKRFFDPNFDGDPELVEVEPLVPQLQAEKATSSDEMLDGTLQDVSQPVNAQNPIDLEVKDGGTTYQEDQEPAVSPSSSCVTFGAPVPIEEEGNEQGSIVETSSQQQKDFPDVEQPPVSIGVSGEIPTTVEPPALIKQLKMESLFR